MYIAINMFASSVFVSSMFVSSTLATRGHAPPHVFATSGMRRRATLGACVATGCEGISCEHVGCNCVGCEHVGCGQFLAIV